MLLKDALKVIAACEIYENDMPKMAKIQLMRFVEVASVEQLHHYLIREDITPGKDIIMEGTKLKVAALLAVGYAIGRAIYKRTMSQAARSCSPLSGSAKSTCINAHKRRALQSQINSMKQEMGKCGETGNEDACREAFMSRIDTAENKILKMM